jgi:hypothetical protein
MQVDRPTDPENLIGLVLPTGKSAPIHAYHDEPTNFWTKSG